MGVRQKRIAVHDLQVGMFVSDLDRPWHETPFPIQGFHIRSQEEIRQLVACCRYVFVDVAEGRDAVEAESATGRPRVAGRRQGGPKVLKLPPVHVRNPRRYETTTSLKREVKHADRLLADVRQALSHLEEQIRHGEPILVEQTEAVAEGMVDSIIRNPDALIWLSRVQHRDEYTYRHSLNTAIWSLAFGRHLGLQPEALKHLAMGSLLNHVGKARLPASLLKDEQDLDAQSLAEYRRYVELGAALLEEGGQPPVVVNIVRHHRERHNGTGFPQGVTGDRTPLLAKISGLVDYYESLIEPREGHAPRTPAQAVGHLYELRNIEFQEDLVERFIQAVGVYPTGTIVELNDNHIGVVLSQRENRRLWPRVLVMTDEVQRPLKEGRIVDLAAYNEQRGKDEALQVARCLPFGSEGIDPARYEVTGATSKWSWRHLVG